MCTDLLGSLLRLILYWHWPNASEHASSIFAFVLLGFYAWHRYDHRAFFVVPVFVVLFYDAIFKVVNSMVFGQWVWGPLNMVAFTMFAFLYWVLGYKFPTWTIPVAVAANAWSVLDGFRYSYGFGAPASAATSLYPNLKEVLVNLGVVVAVALQIRMRGLKDVKGG